MIFRCRLPLSDNSLQIAWCCGDVLPIARPMFFQEKSTNADRISRYFIPSLIISVTQVL